MIVSPPSESCDSKCNRSINCATYVYLVSSNSIVPALEALSLNKLSTNCCDSF